MSALANARADNVTWADYLTLTMALGLTKMVVGLSIHRVALPTHVIVIL